MTTSINKVIADALTATHQARPPATDRPEVVIVDVPKESRLEQLLCREEKVRAAYAAAEAERDELRKAVIAEVEALYPGNRAPTKGYEIPGGPMWNPLRLSWHEGREYLEDSLIKEHIPQIWDAFKKKGKGYWDFRRAGKR